MNRRRVVRLIDMIGRTYLERGRPVIVVTRWSGRGPRNVLIRRDDGRLVVRPFRGLRRPAENVGRRCRFGAGRAVG